MDLQEQKIEKWLQCDCLNNDKYCHRKFLPTPMTKKNEESNLWSLVKSNTGKDLSKTTMPIHLNEPISFLQRISEYMEYSNLLFQASMENDPISRLELITAFVISDVSSTHKRSGKPFNPLLGETFELNRQDERGYIFVSEQVSHHPPISAFYVEAAPYFRFWGSLYPKLQFWGKSLEIYPKGNLYIHLLEFNEVYTWENVPSVINNLLIGKVNICHQGENTIKCLTTNTKAILKWKSEGWFKIGEDCASNRIEAHLYNSKLEKVKVVYGRWNEVLYSVTNEDWKLQHNNKKLWRTPLTDSAVTGVVSKLGNLRFFPSSSFQIIQPSSLEVPDPNQMNYICSSPVDCKKTNPSSSSCASSPTSSDDIDLHLPHQTCIWKSSRRPPHSRLYYDFTYFTLILNEISQDYDDTLPPTDSRKRPDIRLLEQGNIDEASKEKCRLENKQRQTRKNFKTKKCSQECQALWFDFKQSEFNNTSEWIFNGKYFHRNWEKCPDIF